MSEKRDRWGNPLNVGDYVIYIHHGEMCLGQVTKITEKRVKCKDARPRMSFLEGYKHEDSLIKFTDTAAISMWALRGYP